MKNWKKIWEEYLGNLPAASELGNPRELWTGSTLHRTLTFSSFDLGRCYWDLWMRFGCWRKQPGH